MTPTSPTGQKPPKSWLVESILVTLFCCLPFGIAGIVNASKVESRFYAGDVEGSNRSSAEAAKWTKIGFWVGIAVVVLYIIVWVVILGGAIGAGVLNSN
jgi:Interferon-induced transmembrane protein